MCLAAFVDDFGDLVFPYLLGSYGSRAHYWTGLQ